MRGIRELLETGAAGVCAAVEGLTGVSGVPGEFVVVETGEVDSFAAGKLEVGSDLDCTFVSVVRSPQDIVDIIRIKKMYFLIVLNWL